MKETEWMDYKSFSYCFIDETVSKLFDCSKPNKLSNQTEKKSSKVHTNRPTLRHKHQHYQWIWGRKCHVFPIQITNALVFVLATSTLTYTGVPILWVTMSLSFIILKIPKGIISAYPVHHLLDHGMCVILKVGKCFIGDKPGSSSESWSGGAAR